MQNEGTNEMKNNKNNNSSSSSNISMKRRWNHGYRNATQRFYSLTSRGNGISEMRPNDRFNYPEKNKMSGFSKWHKKDIGIYANNISLSIRIASET